VCVCDPSRNVRAACDPCGCLVRAGECVCWPSRARGAACDPCGCLVRAGECVCWPSRARGVCVCVCVCVLNAQRCLRPRWFGLVHQRGRTPPSGGVGSHPWGFRPSGDARPGMAAHHQPSQVLACPGAVCLEVGGLRAEGPFHQTGGYGCVVEALGIIHSTRPRRPGNRPRFATTRPRRSRDCSGTSARLGGTMHWHPVLCERVRGTFAAAPGIGWLR
jgi:hypothetical protein